VISLAAYNPQCLQCLAFLNQQHNIAHSIPNTAACRSETQRLMHCAAKCPAKLAKQRSRKQVKQHTSLSPGSIAAAAVRSSTAVLSWPSACKQHTAGQLNKEPPLLDWRVVCWHLHTQACQSLAATPRAHDGCTTLASMQARHAGKDVNLRKLRRCIEKHTAADDAYLACRCPALQCLHTQRVLRCVVQYISQVQHLGDGISGKQASGQASSSCSHKTHGLQGTTLPAKRTAYAGKQNLATQVTAGSSSRQTCVVWDQQQAGRACRRALQREGAMNNYSN
jgi:hypothetical protein